jgi:hypothetical protein
MAPPPFPMFYPSPWDSGEYWMARPLPYLFCHYWFYIDEEPLGFEAQLQALQELQGQYFARSARGARATHLDSIVMRPREVKVETERAIAWSVGRKIGERQTFEYDQPKDKIESFVVDDPSLVFSDFVAIPQLGVLAVDDRSGPHHLGGRAAINRFRSIFRNLEGGDVDIEPSVTPQDVHKALANWGITEFAFVLRPFNPHPPGDLSKRLSEQFSKDGIGTYRGKAEPKEGEMIKPSHDGVVAAATELADAGYGQYSIKGVTPEGHEAQIKQPKFDHERQKNEKRQAENRELRIIIEGDGDIANDVVVKLIVKALKGVYE